MQLHTELALFPRFGSKTQPLRYSINGRTIIHAENQFQELPESRGPDWWLAATQNIQRKHTRRTNIEQPPSRATHCVIFSTPARQHAQNTDQSTLTDTQQSEALNVRRKQLSNGHIPMCNLGQASLPRMHGTWQGTPPTVTALGIASTNVSPPPIEYLPSIFS
ncbi:hypothetical protein FF38_07437 [Lucilia cuprina]|uniref:Uncharacterized protein n=1 Tax=Lucilia cuprina TaxID=7375 RepID=A0A0L0CPV3_LUCCU|nr:hypothetical protein FF38_07437 [Lucilia cuprina]